MKKKFFNFLAHLVLIIFSLIILLPLLWIFRNSFTDKLHAYKIPPEFSPLIVNNYIEIFSKYPFDTYFLNSNQFFFSFFEKAAIKIQELLKKYEFKSI